ncbi:hypothetical protein B0J12DRAFT_611943 [Macrophomina phaseolina]|uniref:Fumarylacetoacetase-like C-terminal domain-containing protein n=1 Tax=Macrophomina phaseolina TaxID=35725 RepID=A0ABQ8FPL3_9PEZI|nr:hypothetical protein B0J12DRAFT_611943 [Macrophomina phaseolina]
MAFKKLVRYESATGEPQYGDLIESKDGSFSIRKLDGDIRNGFSPTDDVVQAMKLLSPISETPAIICIGVNYRTHAKEASIKIPPYPVVFMKPPGALAGPGDITVDPAAQKMLDYEGELVFILSRDAKNLGDDFELSDYILGYTAGNDLSARHYQLPDNSGGQFCYAKSFDWFAPIGPWVVNSSEVPNPQALSLKTLVNGEVRQQTQLDDMIWSVKDILKHLSQGTTVRAGTVVMTGTPSGVGVFQEKLLKDGDEVVVEVEGVGELSNVLIFQQ